MSRLGQTGEECMVTLNSLVTGFVVGIGGKVPGGGLVKPETKE